MKESGKDFDKNKFNGFILIINGQTNIETSILK